MKQEGSSYKQEEASKGHFDPEGFIKNISQKHKDESTGCIAMVSNSRDLSMDISTNNLSIDEIFKCSVVFMSWSINQFYLAAAQMNPQISINQVLEEGVRALREHLLGTTENEMTQSMIEEYSQKCTNTERS